MINKTKINKTKINRTISLNINLNTLMNKLISNKSKYIEWLIYNDLKNNSKDEIINKIKL
jgi:hypothetical protein